VKRLVLVTPFVALAVACAAAPPPDPSPPTPFPVATNPPPPAQPPAPSIDEAALDPRVQPCDDFYEYACAGWMKAHPRPAGPGQPRSR